MVRDYAGQHLSTAAARDGLENLFVGLTWDGEEPAPGTEDPESAAELDRETWGTGPEAQAGLDAMLSRGRPPPG